MLLASSGGNKTGALTGAAGAVVAVGDCKGLEGDAASLTAGVFVSGAGVGCGGAGCNGGNGSVDGLMRWIFPGLPSLPDCPAALAGLAVLNAFGAFAAFGAGTAGAVSTGVFVTGLEGAGAVVEDELAAGEPGTEGLVADAVVVAAASDDAALAAGAVATGVAVVAVEVDDAGAVVGTTTGLDAVFVDVVFVGAVVVDVGAVAAEAVAAGAVAVGAVAVEAVDVGTGDEEVPRARAAGVATDAVVTGAAAALLASLLASLVVAGGTEDVVPGLAGLAAATAGRVTVSLALALAAKEGAVWASAGAVVDRLPFVLEVAGPTALVVVGVDAPRDCGFEDNGVVPLPAVAGSALAGAAFSAGGLSLVVALTAPQGFGSTCAAGSARETSAAGVPVPALPLEAGSAPSADIGRDSSAKHEAKDEGSIIL